MTQISETFIKQLFPSLIYKRGLDYYKNNRVAGLSYDVNHRVWTAMVQGSDEYFVEVNPSSIDQGTLEAYCDCPAFGAYSHCKHVVAVLLAVHHKKKTNETGEKPGFSSYHYERTNQFIQELRSVQQDEGTGSMITNRLPMRVKYNLRWTYDDYLQVELKTGIDHCYVVRDLYEFLNDVMQGNEHYFTKKFTYDPEVHSFLQQDLEILERLALIYENEVIYNNTWNTFRPEVRKEKRYLTIPPLVAKQLLKLLADRPLTATIQDQTYEQVAMKEGELPFHFSLTKNDEQTMLLSLEEINRGTYLEFYKIFFMDGIFYFLSKEQASIMDRFNTYRRAGVALPVTRSQADIFLSEAVPKLEKIGDVTISESIEAETVRHPLQAKLYLEIKDAVIAGKLSYHYGNEEIDPFNENSDHHAIIIRDVEKEDQIMQLIEHANFHYNGKELYIEPNEEEWYTFLYEVMPQLEQHVELFLTSELKRLLIDEIPSPTTNIQLESSSNLLDIGFNIEGIDRSEISNILNAVIEKKRFYRLQSGEVLPLGGEEFSSIQQLLSELNVKKEDIEDGMIQVPVYRGAQVDELVEGRKDYSPAFKELLRSLRSPEALEYSLPQDLQAELRAYQKTG